MRNLIKHKLIPYPRTLYIGFLCKETINIVCNNFTYRSGDKILKEDFEGGEAHTIPTIQNNNCNYVIIVLFSPKSLSSIVFSHEAFHVVDSIVNDCGLRYVNDTGNEHIAYYIGYIVSLFEEWKAKILKLK